MSSKLYCHPCARKGGSSVADKYCTDCDENLCIECVTAHDSFKAFTSHCLVDSLAPSSKLSIKKSCSKHDDMTLDFFCADHDCLCCRLCMSESHRSCKKFVPLEVAAKGVKRSAMFDDVYTTLSNVKKTLEKMHVTRENDTRVLRDDEKKALTELAAFKAKILKTLNEAEKELKSQVRSTAQKYRSKIETEKGTISQLASSVDEITRQINFASEHSTESQIFCLVNFCKWELVRHETKIREIIPTLETTRISFSRDDFDISRLNALGTVKVESFPCKFKYTATKINQAQVQPLVHQAFNQSPTNFTLNREIYIQSTEAVQITSISVTDDNRLLLCNINSEKILVYSDRGDHLQDFMLAGAPRDSAVLSGEDKAVFCLYKLQKIQVIHTRSMVAGDTIALPGDVFGIAVVKDKICVSGDAKIYILNKQAKYETTIKLPIVGYIWYLCQGLTDSVYYTALDQHQAGCVNLTGKILFTYTDDNFEGPEAIVTDKGGNIYIACRDSNTIYRLTSEGRYTDVILTEDDGIRRPCGLAFSKDFRELFVSNEKNKKISIFSCK